MPVFLERFLLPAFAAIVVLVAITNPMGLDAHQRITGAAALCFAAYFVAHTIYRERQSTDRIVLPPIRVEVPGFGAHLPPEGQEKLEINGQVVGERGGTLTFPIYILNTARDRRVSLAFIAFRIDIIPPAEATGLVIDGLGVKHNLTMNLGPGEDTRGHFSVGIAPSHYRSLPEGRHRKVLVIQDRVSDTSAEVIVPGKFPTGVRRK